MNAITEAYDRQQFLYFDIETLPCQDLTYLDKLRETIKPPGNIKKPESIEKWLAENRDAAALDALAKTSFDGGRGHVCAISWAINEGQIFQRVQSPGLSETAIMRDFFGAFDPYKSQTLVGHNIIGFDIGFLRKRAVVLGIPMPADVNFPRDPKPWAQDIHDTMVMWAGGRDTISMNNLCEVLGIEGKTGFVGSMVAEAWSNGEYEKISEYCADDVEITREIHQRFLLAGW